MQSGIFPQQLQSNDFYIENCVSLNDTIENSSVSSNFTDWGPKRDSLNIVIPITVIYVLIFVSGVFGNIITCVVISRNKSMHTATNYYLFSLAISDLLLLVSGLPPEIYSIWSKYPYVFGEIFCILQGFFAETSANATVLTITAFTVERYIAICHPFLSHSMSKLNRAVKLIIIIWMFALCLAIPQAMAFGVVCAKNSKEHCVCGIKTFVIPHAFEISFLVFFIVPMLVITILYVLIGRQLKKTSIGPKRGNSVRMKRKMLARYSGSSGQIENTYEKNEDGRMNFNKNAQATKHVVKMLIAVVAAFFACWAPFHAQRLLAVHGERWRHSRDVIDAFQTLTYVSGVAYYLSTTVNPLLYHTMSNKYRKAFAKTYKQICHKCRCTESSACYSNFAANASPTFLQSNTDSFQNSLKYEPDLLNLRESPQPLFISFKKKPEESEVHQKLYVRKTKGVSRDENAL